jgi:hypothetical protein
MERVRLLELRLTIHNSINAESSIPAESRVHHVSLYDTLVDATTSHYLHLRWCLTRAGLGISDALLCTRRADPDLEKLPETISCPEISENNYKGKVCDEPVFTIVRGKTKVWPGMKTQDTSGGRDNHAAQEQRPPPLHHL